MGAAFLDKRTTSRSARRGAPPVAPKHMARRKVRCQNSVRIAEGRDLLHSTVVHVQRRSLPPAVPRPPVVRKQRRVSAPLCTSTCRGAGGSGAWSAGCIATGAARAEASDGSTCIWRQMMPPDSRLSCAFFD